MKKFLSLTIAAISSVGLLYAGGRTEAGLTLLEAPGARSAALGEAFSAMANDVTAYSYNPATLRTLLTSHMSFLYQKGINEDAYGSFYMGLPRAGANLGFSVGFYDGGQAEVFDGISRRSVKAQSDMVASIGGATEMGALKVGVSGKYISSELAESVKASAFALDLGVITNLTAKLRMGAAIQNLGTKLQYDREADPLPRIARVGMAYQTMIARVPTSLFIEAPYHFNQSELRPAVGAEVMAGPLAFRAGYQTGRDLEEISVGTGFLMGSTSLDYSFGLVDELDARHRVSLSMRFGSSIKRHELTRRHEPEKETAPVEIARPQPGVTEYKRRERGRKSQVGFVPAPPQKIQSRRLDSIYTVKPGDSLKSIAIDYYGRESMWEFIYNANKHLMDDPERITVGMKIILPPRGRP